MKKLTYRDRDSGRDIEVGKWLSEEKEDESILMLKDLGFLRVLLLMVYSVFFVA